MEEVVVWAKFISCISISLLITIIFRKAIPLIDLPPAIVPLPILELG